MRQRVPVRWALACLTPDFIKRIKPQNRLQKRSSKILASMGLTRKLF